MTRAPLVYALTRTNRAAAAIAPHMAAIENRPRKSPHNSAPPHPSRTNRSTLTTCCRPPTIGGERLDRELAHAQSQGRRNREHVSDAHCDTMADGLLSRNIKRTNTCP